MSPQGSETVSFRLNVYLESVLKFQIRKRAKQKPPVDDKTEEMWLIDFSLHKQNEKVKCSVGI